MVTLGALALGAGMSATGALIGSGLNAYFQNRENKIMREREDNAISRRVRDLEASGLSPTLAAGSPASATAGTAPNVGDGVSHGADFMTKYLSLVQQKSEIDHTNSQVSLNQLMADSELYKQAFMRAQTDGENLRNNWINALNVSTLDLRDKQGQKIGAEIKELVENTALLKAKTAYEQENLNFLKTQHDNERLRRDMNMVDLFWQDEKNRADVWNKYTSGNIAKSIAGGFKATAESLFNKEYPFPFEMSRDWYWENNKK